MAAGKETYHSLRQLVRRSDFRRFRARHRDNRWADFLGFTPNGEKVVGFWDGDEEPTLYDADEIQWTQLVTYV